MAARRHDVGEGWPHGQQALKDAGEPGAVLQSLAKVVLQWVPLRATHEHCMQLTSAQGASSEHRHSQVPLSEHSHPATQQPLESFVLWRNLRCLKTDITKAGPMTLAQGSRAYSRHRHHVGTPSSHSSAPGCSLAEHTRVKRSFLVRDGPQRKSAFSLVQEEEKIKEKPCKESQAQSSRTP